jgi:hypothetical protein
MVVKLTKENALGQWAKWKMQNHKQQPTETPRIGAPTTLDNGSPLLEHFCSSWKSSWQPHNPFSPNRMPLLKWFFGFQWIEQRRFGRAEKTATGKSRTSPGEHTRLACRLTASRRKPRQTIFSAAQNTLPPPLPRKAKPLRFSSPPQADSFNPFGI